VVTPERLAELLRTEPLPPAREARDRAIALGRELALKREEPLVNRRRDRRPALLVAAAALALLVVALTPPGGAVARWVDGLFATGEPGGAPTNHPPAIASRDGRPAGKAYVLAAGRAPDGVRYELVVAHGPQLHVDAMRRTPDGELEKTAGHCTSFSWPDVPLYPEGVGFSELCLPGRFPTEYLIDDLARHNAAARPYTFLNPPRHTREYMYAYGFALPEVTRVRVLYETGTGELKDAPVDLIEPSAEAHERIGSRRPLDVFVTFLPYAAGRLEDPLPQERPRLPSTPYHVIAYDKNGNILSHVERTDLANAPAGETWAPRPDCVTRQARLSRPGELAKPHAGPSETCYERVPAELQEPRGR
jgi:hypothetical protein